MADNNGYSNHTNHGNHGTHKKQRYNDDDDDEFSSESNSNSNSNSNSESFISSSSESNNTVYESEAFKNFEYFSDSEEDEDEDEDEYDNTEGGMKSRPYTYAMINGKIRRTPSKSKTFSINGSTAAAKQKAARRNATYYDDSDYDEDRDFNTIFDVSKHGKAEKERKKHRPVSWKTQFIGSLKKNARYLTRNTTRLAVNIAFPLATLWVVWLVTCAILTIKKPMTAYNNPVMDYPEEPLPTFSSAGASELCGRNSTSCGLAVYPRSANSFSFRVLIREALKDPVTGQKPTLQFYDDEAAFIKEMSDFPGRHFGGIAFHCSSTPTNGLCRNYTLHMSADLLPLRSAGDSPVNVFSGAMAASHNASLYISSGLMTLQNAVDSALARMDKLFPRLFNLTVRTKALPVAKVNYVSLPLGLVFAAGGGLSLVPLLCAITGLALFERVYHVRYYLFILGMRRSAYWLALVVTAVALGIVLGVLWVFVCCAAVWTGGGIAAVLTLAGAWVGYLATLLLLVFAVHKVVDTPFWNFFVMITFAAAVPALSSLIPSMTTVQGVLSGFLSPYTFYLIVASVTGSALHGPAPTPFSMLELFAFLVGDFVLYGFVCWFVNESCSGDYGVSRGPLFFLHKSYWRPVRQTTLMEKAQLSKNSLPQRNFEPPLADDFGVRIYGLTKVYDGNTGRKKMGCAVNGLSAPFCKGQVTCILGQDGSGKSTLLSMLCGLIRPTSGEALVDGRSILSDLDAVQKVIGYCPGTDVLYPDLTPEDHIDFISCVRGKKSRLSGSRFGASAGPGTGNNNNGRARNPNAADTTFTTRVLADVGLLESRKSKASSLTPGMRRRLSLAVALIGDPKIVFIDDPSGDGENRIDIASKRIIWTALKRIRGARRTIVFTSRSIEEAEHLGDYVYFMDEGKFKCGGTPEFLEKRFGVGYYLNVIAHTEGKIRKVVKECVPGATFVASTSKSILFKLPFSQTQLYSALFRRLENDGPALGVTKFKLHLNTLGDVFSKICTKVASKNENGDDKEKTDTKSAESTGDEKDEKDTENEEEEEEEEEEDKLYSRNVTPSVDDYTQSSDGAGIGNESSLLLSKSNLGDSAGLSGQYGGSVARRDGTGHPAAAAAPARKQASFFRQLLALLKYKFLFFVRRPVIFVYLILVPLGYLLVSLFVVHGCFHVIDIHGENAKLMYHNISRYEPSYIPFVISSGSEVVHDDVERFMQIMQSPTLRMAPVENVSVLNRIAYARENNVNMALIFNAFNIDRNMADITVMYNQTDLTSPVAILDFMQSGIYSLLEKRHYDPSGLWVHPVAFSGTYSDTASSGRIHSRLVYGVVGIIMTVFACIRVSTKLAKNATEERVNGFKTQLYTAGLRPAVYVISTISISLIPLVFVYAISEPIFAGFGVGEFAEWETFPIVFLGMLLFFISLSSFNLAFSNGFRTPPNASRALFAILIAITVVPILLSPLSLIVPQALTSVFKFIFGLVSPPYAFANLLWTILVQDDALPFTSRILWKK